MPGYLGDIVAGGIIRDMWSSNDSGGASVTRATNGTVSVYKDDSTTQSTTGVTDTEDFDGVTGVHHWKVDTSADGTFYSAGSDFFVVLSGATIDGQTVNHVLGTFSIESRTQKADVRKWIGNAVATPTVNGVPEMDLTHIGGDAQSATDAKDFFDAGYDPSTNKVQGVVLVDTTTDLTTKTGMKLASDGLDQISAADPAGVADTWPKMVVQLWRRFFKKSTFDGADLITYGDDGSTVRTTQACTDAAGTQTQGAAA